MVIKKYKARYFYIISLFFLIIIFLILNFKNIKLGNIDQEFRIILKQPVLFSSYNTPKKNIQNFYMALNEISNKKNFEKLSIDISFKNFEKLKNDRKKALENGILTDPIVVNGSINWKNKSYPARIRLKGDFNDHRSYSKQWSLKINLKKKKTIMGYNEFSLSSHNTRGYPDSFIIRKNLQRINLLTPDTETVFLKVNGDDWGLMAIEEQFSKNYLERKKRKEVPIFRLSNEEHMKISSKLNNLKNNYQINTDEFNLLIKELPLNQGIIEVKTYNKDSILKSTNIPNTKTNLNLFTLMQSINEIVVLEDFYLSKFNFDKERLIKKYFDSEKFTKTLITSLVSGENHSLYKINSRFTINPFTQKIEPIPNDFHYLKPTLNLSKKDISNISIDKIENNRFFDSAAPIYKFFINSNTFKNEYLSALIDFEENLAKIKMDYSNFCKPFGKICLKENSVNGFSFNYDILKENYYFLRKINLKIFDYLNLNNDNSRKNVDVKNIINKNYNNLINQNIFTRIYNDGNLFIYNLTKFPLKLEKIIFYKTQNCKTNCSDNVITLYPKKHYNLKKNNEYITVDKINIENFFVNNENFKIKNLNLYNYSEIFYKTQNLTKFISQPIENHKFQPMNLLKKSIFIPDFVKIENNNYIIKSGNYLSESIILPEKKNLIIEENTEINFKKNSLIYLNGGCLLIKGNNQRKIKLSSKNSYWRGIYVNGCKDINEIKYTIFENLDYFSHENIQLTGAINFYNTSVKIKNSSFYKNIAEDFINITNSSFNFNDLEIYNSSSDAIDIDFSEGIINKVEIFKAIGDAIDTSGSIVSLKNIYTEYIGDKGLSFGENSLINLDNINIKNSSIGIASKDNSKVVGSDITIFDSKKYDVAVYNKKKMYGGGHININKVKHQNKFLNQINSIALINNKNIKNKKFNSNELYSENK